ncbi:NAD(P)-dependent oxidoreductase [Streptomyces sp. CSDS2]|uniref:NAD-dependent epimerase/dehydratase family protein n=1 Tax=Streptomyces sp. CSDS2 TaxID=3055051 RepID=UPI0025B1125E|nr:NAD(P)-dependent oxidoreductase [Streptomyces sp. CSDS2]MDN3262824.1 NAD(P)-dependent oxidoreductase [Streptomyces sp. CSDS2]
MTHEQPCVVVLGGSGFVGGHLRAAFRSSGARVVSVSRTRPDGVAGNGPAAERFVAFDLLATSPAELAAMLAGTGADVVVNAAGGYWKMTDQQMWRANTELVSTLVAAVRELPHRPLLIQLGSVHEYGPGSRDTGFTEERTPAPVNAYGRSKLEAAHRVLEAAGASELNGVVLRIANIIGPGLPAGSLLGDIAAHLERFAQDGEAADRELVLGPLNAERDFIDVRDVADAVLAVTRAPRADITGRVINIGSGEAVSAARVAKRLIELSALPVRLVERARTGPSRGDVDCQMLDISRARQLLGWMPRRDLDASLTGLLTAA